MSDSISLVQQRLDDHASTVEITSRRLEQLDSNFRGRLEQLDDNFRGMQTMIEERLLVGQQQVNQREGPVHHQENPLLENEVLQQPIHHPRPGSLIPRPIKLEFPRFSGGDPSSWILRAMQFFRYYEIPEEEKIFNASYHLDDEALVWFQDCERSLDSWETFVKAIQVRFGPSS